MFIVILNNKTGTRAETETEIKAEAAAKTETKAGAKARINMIRILNRAVGEVVTSGAGGIE